MFEEFIKRFSAEIRKDLPGLSAQRIMDPLGRMSHVEYLTKKDAPKKSAVLILLYPDPFSFALNTVLIHRPENEGGSHAGQVSFPGGGYDASDADLMETALREAEEEIGADRMNISVAGALTPLFIPVSNYMVYPYVGITDKRPEFKIHPVEVDSLLECSIDEFLMEANKGTTVRHIKMANKDIKVPCYFIKEKIIWGATAMIISELEVLLKRSR